MTSNQLERPRRTYTPGGRPGRPAQLLGLGPAMGLVAAGFAVAALLTSMYSMTAALTVAGAGVLLLAPMAIRVGPARRTIWSIVAAEFLWAAGRRRRKHLWRTGIADQIAEHRLPGLLARSQLWEVDSGLGGAIGIIHVPRTRHYTAVLHCYSEGLDLVDQSVIDRRVDHYATWLTALTREVGLAQAQVIIETAPDPGHRLAAEIDATTIPGAPELAKVVLDEIKASAPTAAATVDVYAVLTWKAKGQVDHTETALRIMNRLPALRAGLEGTGAVAIRAMDAAQLTRVMHVVYDPAESDRPALADLDWAQVGPGFAREGMTWYVHGSGISATLGLVEPPRGKVTEQVFSRLAMPDPDVLRKRVSLIYHPYTAAQARAQVERDRTNAVWNANTEKSRKGRVTDRTRIELESADKASAEEAAGAGLTRYTVLATVTVANTATGPKDRKLAPEDEKALAAALRRLETAAGDARIQLRDMRAAQSACFAGNTVAGVVLPDHAPVADQ